MASGTLNAYLVRTAKTSTHTLGYLFLGNKWFRTLERPWKDNERNNSCIPTGTYRAVYLPRSASGKYRSVYHLLEVPDRSGILIHNGNLVSHTRGCILLGTRIGRLGAEMAVLNSRTAMQQFNELLDGQPFQIEVI